MTFNLKILAAAALLAGSVGLASEAGASPAGPVAASGIAGGDRIEPVAQGCGPGFFRGPRGYCRPMGGGYGGPRRFHGGRCFVRPTPFGPRRVCR